MGLERKYSSEWKEDWKRALDFCKAAEKNLNMDDYKTAANRIYFTAESAVIAALKINSKQVSRNHQKNWMYSKLLEWDIDSYELLRNLYDLRKQADYGSASEMIKLNKEVVSDYLNKTKRLLDEIKRRYCVDKK